MALNTTQLVTAVAQLKTIDASAVAAINGIPAVVAAAVAKALSDAGIDDTAAQAAVDQATADATQVATDLQTALTANTPSASS